MTKKLSECTPEEAEKIRVKAKEYKSRNRQKLASQAADRHAWRYANEPEYRARKDRQAEEARFKKRYGMLPKERDEMLAAQGCRCAICGTDQPGKSRSGKGENWHTDHCHSTGKVRGILCASCNVFLGKLEKRRATLGKFLDYLGGN